MNNRPVGSGVSAAVSDSGGAIDCCVDLGGRG